MNPKSFLITYAAVSLSLLSAAAYSPNRHPVPEPTLPQTNNSLSTNLFQHAKVTASGVYKDFLPELAVDGNASDSGKYWGCENLPVWLQVDMGKPQSLSSIRFWPYWADGRIYQFKIEGSKDGKVWKTLVDQSANSISGTADGSTYTFPATTVRYVRTTITNNSAGKQSGGHIVEIQGFAESDHAGLQAIPISADERQPGDRPIDPSRIQPGIIDTAWRGERVNGQIAISGDGGLQQVRLSTQPLIGPDGTQIPVSASFVRFTGADKDAIADIIDPDWDRIDIPAGQIRSVWVQADIPVQTVPGAYKGVVSVHSQGQKSIDIPIKINVMKAALPPAKDWTMHLDLWQHPEAVARWHDVKPWSKEHFDLMRPLMKRLADAGQKTITCSLIHEAWNEQTYDWWPSMIEWIKNTDGTMSYDYTNFDKWVDFMSNDIGMKDAFINCYTMVPWSMKLRYLDKASGEYKEQPLNPDNAEYEAIWGPFLTDFVKHLKQKGWLERTCIGLDERPDKMVAAAQKLLDQYTPGMRMVSAFNHPTSMTDRVYDLSISITHADTVGKVLEARKKKGQKTTFYICCSPAKPNTFTKSSLAESEWLGIFAAANNLDGILRWAYNSWGRNPLENTDFGNWKPGDCYLVYPGNRSSLRFEKLRDGLEDFEKITILRKQAASPKASAEFKKAVSDMNVLLKELFTVKRSSGNQHKDDIIRARAAINKASALS